MKKLLFSLLLVALAAPAAAQSYFETLDYYTAPPKRYINLGYVLDQQLEFDDPAAARYGGKAEWAGSFEAGTTYFINRLPWAEILRLGIDFSYLDLQYAQYRNRVADIDNPQILSEVDSHFGSIGIQVGPSLTVSPWRDVHLKGYVHYSPTFTAFASEDWNNVLGGYAGYVTGGVSASWRMFTLGWEARSGSADLTEITTDEDQIGQTGTIFGDKQHVKMPSMRLYLGFRF